MACLLGNWMINFIACLGTERTALEPSSNCEAYFPTDSLSAPLSMGSGKYADFV